ncbi:glycosyltransferase family 2 protein [Amycolatopsis aidingensis]|uniref:glycosyltransferase family 2 protein n=1 Tax=Amycolatopsis aidingensis TaxID=2842453 RepID=UPI001E39EE6F|nr:glycosyltransferase family 2 protein [Amycolatopsis aidingensis]
MTAPRVSAPAALRTAPVLAILVCHNGAAWLPLALSALRRSEVRPRHVLAVDTGSDDRTADILADAADPAGAAGERVLSGVLSLPEDTGFAAAVAEAIAHAGERWGDPGSWIWLLHDDCAPEPDCLGTLLNAAEAAPSAGVLGPLAVGWTDPRLIVEAGLSLDASGHRQHAVPRDHQQSTEVLAVPSAGSLIRRELWERLGGFDPDLPLLREDVDFGWRVNSAGSLVLSVPRARLRHARAASTGERQAHALPGSLLAADRAHGLRTFLANCGPLAFLLGLPRLVLLSLLRGLGFALLRRPGRARAEFAAVRYLTGGHAGLRAARARRRSARSRLNGSVRGLLTSRFARLRNLLRGGMLQLVRRRVASEAALGRLPEAVPDSSDPSAWVPPEAARAEPRAARPVGPEALPAGAMRAIGTRARGLRTPREVVAVALPEQEPQRTTAAEDAADERGERPTPGAAREPELVFVEVNRRRILAATVFAPPVVLFLVLTAFGLVLHGSRLGLDPAGGRLLPVGGLDQLWSSYLASWHPVGGGTSSAAPAALAVLGTLGAVFLPLGGPPALVALLLLGHLPLAALVAYAATSGIRVHRWVRAGVAAGYALLPAGAAGVAQGRLGVVLAHILLPAVIAGIAAVLTRAGRRWLSVAVLTALALAVLGAFSPLAHALALVALVGGFVLLPAAGGLGRRIAAVAIVVLLPLGLLLPWLPALLTHPALVLHGLGGTGSRPPGTADLLGLAPGGPGALPTGVAVLVAALVALVLRPTRRALPGLAVLLLGIGGVVAVRLLAVQPVHGGPAAIGYTGVPLLVAGAGLLWVVLAACTHRADTPAVAALLPRLGAAGGVLVLLTLAAGGVLAATGPLRADGGWSLASSLTRELSATGRSVLVLGGPGEPVRQSGGRLPRFGDDELVPVPGTPERLSSWQRDLLAGSREAVTSAAAAGALFVVLPQGEDAARLRQAAPDLVAGAPATSDGRQVLRLNPVGGQVTLISPQEARRAVGGQAPTGQLAGGTAVVPVEAELPDIRVRVSDGPAGRLLVLAAESEPGWRASVDGERVPIVRAWGHQVAVAVPARASEVVVEHPSVLRDLLLLGQIAAVLFTALTAIPGRRERTHSPSMTSGSTPR